MPHRSGAPAKVAAAIYRERRLFMRPMVQKAFLQCASAPSNALLEVVNGVSDIVFPAANAEPPVLWAEAVYGSYGASDNINFMAAPGAHGYYQDRREAVAAFFAEHLRSP